MKQNHELLKCLEYLALIAGRWIWYRLALLVVLSLNIVVSLQRIPSIDMHNRIYAYCLLPRQFGY